MRRQLCIPSDLCRRSTQCKRCNHSKGRCSRGPYSTRPRNCRAFGTGAASFQRQNNHRWHIYRLSAPAPASSTQRIGRVLRSRPWRLSTTLGSHPTTDSSPWGRRRSGRCRIVQSPDPGTPQVAWDRKRLPRGTRPCPRSSPKRHTRQAAAGSPRRCRRSEGRPRKDTHRHT